MFQAEGRTVQRSWGINMFVVCKGKQGEQCGWSTVRSGMVNKMAASNFTARRTIPQSEQKAHRFKMHKWHSWWKHFKLKQRVRSQWQEMEWINSTVSWGTSKWKAIPRELCYTYSFVYFSLCCISFPYWWWVARLEMRVRKMEGAWCQLMLTHWRAWPGAGAVGWWAALGFICMSRTHGSWGLAEHH